MNARRWYWFLTFAALAWLLFGPKLLERFKALRDPVQAHGTAWLTAGLAPLSQPLTNLQTRFHRLFVQSPGQEDYEQIRDERDTLRNHQLLLTARVEELERLIKENKMLRNYYPAITRDNVVPGTITGFGSSALLDTCIIDRGSRVGIAPGCVVLAQLAPIGRVMTVGPTTSTVRLITDRDRSARFTARLVHPTAEGISTVADSCLVYGLGQGQMRCDTIPTTVPQAPVPGDLVVLKDVEWPAALQGAVMGEVTKVSKLETNILQWDLRIKPRATLDRTHVIVLLP